jgi:hypothetical protein
VFDDLPYSKHSGQFCYFTFAGSLVNKAIINIIGDYQASFNDISITTYTPINWSQIPVNPQEYEAIFSRLVNKDTELSIYQELLPEELQLQESLQNWLKDIVISEILQRLSKARLVEIN